jgi:hypothetical protein
MEQVNPSSPAAMQDDAHDNNNENNANNEPPNDNVLPEDIRHNIDRLMYTPDPSINQYTVRLTKISDDSFTRWQKIFEKRANIADNIAKLNGMVDNEELLKSVSKICTFDRPDNDAKDDFSREIDHATQAFNTKILELLIRTKTEHLDIIQQSYENFNADCAQFYWNSLATIPIQRKLKTRIVREILTRDKCRQTLFITNRSFDTLLANEKLKTKLEHEADLKQKALDDPETSIKLLITKMLKPNNAAKAKTKGTTSSKKTVNKSYTCKQCTIECNSTKQLKNHVLLKHSKGSKNDRPVKGNNKNNNNKATKKKKKHPASSADMKKTKKPNTKKRKPKKN